MTKQLSKTEQEIIWLSNKDDFKADLTYSAVKRLSSKYIGRNVVDLGAGNGALMIHIKETYGENINISGIDMVPRHSLVKEGDIRQTGFKNSNFDTLFATDVIEHLNDLDLKLFLEEAFRILKPGGYLILTTPYNERLEKSTICCPSCKFEFHRWGHAQSFDEEQIKETLSSYNFNVVSTFKTNLWLLHKLNIGSIKIYLFLINTFLSNICNFPDLFTIAQKPSTTELTNS